MPEPMVIADEPLSMNSAGDQIGALLGTEEAGEMRARDKEGKFVSTRRKADPIVAEERPATETEQETAPEPEPEPEEQDEDSEDTDAPVPRTLRVKVDGQEIDVDEEEVKKGYSRTADYTRKTQELADARKRFEAEDLASVRAERQQYAERLSSLDEAVSAMMPDKEPAWDTLRNQLTPEEFTQQFTEWRVNTQRVERIRAERERVHGLQLADAERQMQVTLTAEHQLLRTALPEFADAEKGKALKDDLMAYAKSLKFSDDDIAGITDHRLLVLLNKARLHDEATRRKPTISAKIDKALDTLKPSSAPLKAKPSDVERGKANLMRSGSVDDAAALISRLGIK